MDRIEVGIAGIVAVLVLLMMRMQVGVVLGIVSFIGISVITSTGAAWGILTAIPMNFVANWSLSAVPMFLLMGFIAAQAGLTNGLFSSAKIFIGRIPGGLASATVLASALFASSSGSSVATAAAFSRIAVPEMLKANYKPSLATGSVAAAGTLGSMIPPSILMILYGIFTNTSIGQLFVAGILPGILSGLAFIVMITLRAMIDPSLAPAYKGVHTRQEIWGHLRDMWPLPILIIGVLGGIFSGVITPTEAGAIGAFCAVLIALARRSLSRRDFARAIIATAEGTCTVFIIAIGATMFSVFLGLTTLPMVFADFLLGNVSSTLAVIAAIAVLYIVLGMFVESLAIMLLTIPIIDPVLQGMGVNMVWFGIIVIKLLEIGLITPPVGLNLFVVKSALGAQVSLTEVIRGGAWFVATDFITLLLIVLVPAISLFLPAMMG
ncbi:TRAP transporter, DctM subunit [Paracoccus halophilus]|uniref:TRAP transporter large permease protein n=1 Tax=Paracoccus halophilus TaxID=376733 RepID=A0A099EVA3_9RHOB|nr:TRAP transporter large permease [Paracoccus halophilus]KGJ01926.1 C4-dicarboxylate ABC transporter [Paracoccus halophilus]SFA62362.1 TRAP transporter, DctM subunit [Paracoccus halophilus]